MTTLISRKVKKKILAILSKKKSVLLLGPRQTGKTTLLAELPLDRIISLADPSICLEYERDIGLFSREIEALAAQSDLLPVVAVDEIQKIPLLTDAVQDLIDRKVAIFILTGSSARKLRRSNQLNLLPGRVIPLHMDPLMISEIPEKKRNIDEIVRYGTLPEILLEDDLQFKEELLRGYITIYLNEEIRQEAAVRNVGQFAQFLQLAALESGNPLNFERIAQDIGVARQTIAGHYQILNDCLIAKKIEPLSRSQTRKRLVKTGKYLFFDVGVRRIASKLGARVPEETLGHLFEEYIGLEILHLLEDYSTRGELFFWRDLNGPEVDWVLTDQERYLPIEVKWATAHTASHIRHLNTFLNEYPSEKGYVVSRIPFRQKLTDNIVAIPWQELPMIIEEFFS